MPTEEELNQLVAEAEQGLREAGFLAPATDVEHAIGDPEKTEERQAAADKAEALALDQSSSAEERKINLALLERLDKQEALMKRLLADNRIAALLEQNAPLPGKKELQRALYHRIRQNGGFCTIQLHTNENPNHNWPVPVTVNNDTFWIPRGVPVVVPVQHLAALDEAELEGLTTIVNEDTGLPEKHHYLISRFPHVVLDETGRMPGAVAPSRVEPLGQAA